MTEGHEGQVRKVEELPAERDAALAAFRGIADQYLCLAIQALDGAKAIREGALEGEPTDAKELEVLAERLEREEAAARASTRAISRRLLRLNSRCTT